MNSFRTVTRFATAPWTSTAAAGLLLGMALRSAWPVLGGGAWGVCGLFLAVAAWTAATDASRAFRHTWASFGMAHLVAFPWVIRHPDPTTAVAGALAIVLIPMLVAAAWAILWSATAGAGLAARALVLSSGTWFVEFALHSGPLPLPWGLPGHVLSSWTWADPMAATMGSPAVAASIILASALLCRRADDAVRRGARATSWIAAGIVLMPVVAFPSPRSTAPDAVSADSLERATAHVRVALVQPGMDPERWDELQDRATLLVSLTDSLVSASDDSPDWIQWPETALRSDAEVEAARRAAARWTIPVVTGALLSNDEATVSNAVLVLLPDLGVLRYDKRRLVPFVEAVPFESALAGLGRGSRKRTRYRPGNSPGVVPLDGTRVGLLICFETLFPSLAAEAAAAGAQALVAVTNDAWWRHPAAARAHLAFSRRRSLEYGLPLIQASVSGFTGVVGPDGIVREALPWMRRGAAIVDVPSAANRRSWPLAPFVFIGMLAAGLMLGRARNQRAPIGVDRAP